MITLTKKLFAAALLMTLGMLTVNAQPVVHPKAYYDAITYEWTDASGVQHTNAITDEATDPYQIVALLKKVYCDPNIPGPKYSAYDVNGNRERAVYYGPVAGGWNISADDVTPPYEDGYTILMVAVKDNLNLYNGDTQQQTGTNFWGNPTYGTFNSNFFTQPSELVQYISDNVAAVQLLSDGLRIGEGLMTGTTFNISGTYDRFFMIGKGQAREKDSWVIQQENSYSPYEIIAGERVPFKSMFEQFSPTDGSDGSQITDFYAKMVGGDIYGVIHDCASVIQVEHYFSMAGKDQHQPRSLTGLNIFIPDYRLLYWEDQYTYNSRRYTVDGRTLNPYKTVAGTSFINSNNRSLLCANYGNYNPEYAPQVGIYTITLNSDAVEGDQEKTYDVVLDWTSSLDNMAHGTVPQNYTVYIVVTDEDGNETYQELTVTGETSYTYTVPQNEHSYTITYIVYGKPADGEHDVFVAWSNQSSVVIPGWNDFLSLTLNHYESDYQSNEELNYYRNFLNLENEDMLNALTPARVQEGENEFTLYRFDVNNPDVMLPVANLTLTVAGNGVRYNIEYIDGTQEPLAGYNVPVTTSGNLSVGAGDAINLSPITFVDQFTASTADNSHPNRYGYKLNLTNDTKGTNTVEVPVFKTTSTIDGYYTLDEVMADTDRHLTAGVKNANVEMNVASNPAIYYYTLDRGDNVNPNEAISMLQHRTDGTFLEMSDVLPQYTGQVSEPGTVERLDNMIITGTPGDFMSYQPVIWTFGEDRVNHDGENSYGSPILRTGVGQTVGSSKGYRSSTFKGEWKDENGVLCNAYMPILTLTGDVPEDASVIYEPFMFRVWRLCDNIRGFKVNPTTEIPYNDPSADRSADALFLEELNSDGYLLRGDGVTELRFGATADAEINFVVRFYYKKVANRGENAEPMYYVVENTFPWKNIPTSVDELSIASEGVKTYYNAQGIASDKPFKGVNIVVTRYNDGTTTTTKVIK
ncbi:MAG: hypothetical protein IJV05_06425 [Muribaculaceae bacterium]|nr:hypothetical protein [Muribaculaceae bacterium]